VWTFRTDVGAFGGYASAYEERDTSGAALLHKDYTWTQDGVGNVYVGTVTTTLNPNTSNQAQSKTVQTLDTYGNLTQAQVYDYGWPTVGSTPLRTYNYTYLADGNYTSRYIRNRMTSVTVTSASGTLTLASKGYDQGSLADRSGLKLHDSSYGTGFAYRGNPTGTNFYGDVKSYTYEISGVVNKVTDGAGMAVNAAPDSSTNYSLPSVLAPNGNTNLQATMTYSSSFAVTSVTGPNGATANTSYDIYGRPLQSTSVDGAQTGYRYTYNPNTQTASLGNRWKTTTLDGFGRVTRVVTGHESVTVSTVDTQYGPCACSPLGKVGRVSQPYARGATPVWTTYSYDGSGRTLSVQAPDGASTTTYSYRGNNTTVTDPAGKWKIMGTDAAGNLFQVTEPDPNRSGILNTFYSYNGANQLIQVSMPRSEGTQTRTLVWSGSDLVSSTNPENGTVSYTYDGAHHVTSRTDAKGQQTQYSYDSYGRLTEVRHYTWGSH
jgi:YD repeat-containing protein